MATSETKPTVKNGAKIITASLVLLAVVLYALFALLVGDTKAQTGTDIPVTSADLNGNGEKYLEIVATNIDYEDYFHIAYIVDPNLDTDMEFSEIKMLFWTSAQSNYVLGSESYSAKIVDQEGSDIDIGGVTSTYAMFMSNGIAAKEIGDTLYARAYVKNADGKAFYSNVTKHGVLDYIYSRYRDASLAGSGVTEDQLGLYDSILSYGANAQTIFEYKTDRLVTSHAVRIDAVDGYLNDGFKTGVYLLGDTVTLVADPQGTTGDFSHWEDSAGNNVSSSQTFELTVDESTVSDTYTAVYHGSVKVTVANGTFNSGLTSGAFKLGDKITLTAADRSADKYVFSHWENDSGENIGSTEVLTLTLIEEGNKTFTAIYHAPSTVKVSGGVFSDGKSEKTFAYGDSFTVTAIDKSGEGKVFKHWLNEKGAVIGNTVIYSGNINTSGSVITLIAEYYSPAFISVSGGTVNGSSSARIPYGEDYTVVAEALSGYVFQNWTKNGTVTDLPVSFTATSDGEDTDYIANYVVKVDNRYDNVNNEELILDDAAIEALRAMDEALFSENVYLWVANLYDPDSGAMYFSISGRDNYGYLPDIETTSQASGVLNSLGIGTYSDLLNAEQKAKLLSWVQTLQSNRDGYNYHPHWGISIGDGRRSRDYTYASTSYNPSGALSFRLFNDANYRLSNGTQGIKGVTTQVEYNNSKGTLLTACEITMPFGLSVEKAVSKAVLTASASANSGVPAHLTSETAFVNYLNTRWNSTCTVTGTHERHICTSSCQVEADQYDSRMVIKNGKVQFIRDERCTSCHECKHKLGHSYSFGHTNGTQQSQLESVGLGELLVNYYYDIQENVQQSLERQNKPLNGIWEEEVTYTTISGLLKICGTPGYYGMEFKYAEEAIASALKCALFTVEDYMSKGEAIVSIYNPHNAISAILSNVRTYGGGDETADAIVKDKIRPYAKELIENTTDKLKGYLMPDGGFSYNYSGYCTTSQGQPTAIEGWNNGVGEGDVNGTALAFGARSALLGVLGVSVGQPFSGDNKYIDGGFDLNGDGDKADSFDLDGDSVPDTYEATCTHAQRFKYLITTKSPIAKADVATTKFTYTFEDGVVGTGGSIVTDGSDKVFEAVDSSNATGHTSSFNGSVITSDKNNAEISFDMKVVSSNDTISHQIFVYGNKGLMLRIDMNYSSGTFTFSNVASDTTALSGVSVNAKNWFTVNIELNPEGFVVNGTTYYGTFKVTQNGSAKSAYIPELQKTDGMVTHMDLYSLNGATTTTRYDDISITANVKAGVYDGEYLFDNVAQKYTDALVQNPTTSSYDLVYPINASGVNFAAYNYQTNDYTTPTVNYNFNSVQLGLLLKDAKAGDRIDLTMLDNAGRKINGIYLAVSEKDGNKLVTFHAPNGDILEESIPRQIREDDGTVTYTTALRQMVLDVDVAQWMTVKLEYHYDMNRPQFDIVVRYGDDTKNSYYTSTAASLIGIDVCDNGADAYSFSNLSVKSTGKIYVDDLYIRNVYDPCSGTHVYIEKATKTFLTGGTQDDHPVYYKSCQKCGAVNKNETFIVHDYERVTEDTYKITDATIYNAATYYESCTVCNKISDNTFTVGTALYDETKWNFAGSGTEAALPSYVTTETGGGKWATLKSENVAGAVNYYMNIGKGTGSSGTNSLTFHASETGASKYVYEFDFRWQGADNHISEIIYVKAGVYNGSKKTEDGSKGSFAASGDGSYATYHGVKMMRGEWHNIKYIYEQNAAGDGWNGTVYVDGSKVHTFAMAKSGIPYINYETRWSGLNVGGVNYPNNVNFDIDRLKSTAITDGNHEYVNIVATQNLVSATEYGAGAIYYKSCKYCGLKSSETFVVGAGAKGTGFENSAMPQEGYLTAGAFGTVVTGSGQLGEWIKSETDANGATNNYLHVEKNAHSGANNVRFVLSSLGDHSKYAAEFDMRWLGATAESTTGVILLKYLNVSGKETENNHTLTSNLNSDLKLGSEIAYKDEWTKVKFEAEETSTNVWTARLYINGILAAENNNISSEGALQIKFETRYGEGYALSFDIDNVRVSYE